MQAILPLARKKMVIENIDILNFKNIEEARLEFSDGVNCLLGRNGMGKSNLLEAIHFVCMARPMSSIPESGLIRHGQDLMSVQGLFAMDNGSAEKVNIGLVRGKGKSLKRNGKEYARLTQHIGRFPIVTVTPADSELIGRPAQERRRMMDMVISQADASYLFQLVRYNKSLESRNSMLRAGMRDALLFESVEAVMAESAAIVHEARKRWIETIQEPVRVNYARIAGAGESINIGYRSSLNDTDMATLIRNNRSKDAALGYTSAGIHRDDMTTEINGYPLKSYGSQGQLKSFTIALRLAVFDYLKKAGGVTPLLLLDDIFDKLDSTRVSNIMQLVSQADTFGQIFITDTNREHLDETLAALSGPKKLISVEEGNFYGEI